MALLKWAMTWKRSKTAEAREYLTRALEIFERLGTLNDPETVKHALAELPGP